jgi:hypothetical protein
MLDPNRYALVVTSKPTSNGRSAFLVRLNPALVPRNQPIEGDLDPTVPISITADRAQTYVCATTTGTPNQELVQAFDTSYFVSRWIVPRVLGENEDRSNLFAGGWEGLVATNNRDGRGVSRKYMDGGFIGAWPSPHYARGGTRTTVDFEWYEVGGVRTLTLMSSDPIRCQVPATYSFTGSKIARINVDLAPVAVRTRYQVRASDRELGVTRVVTLIVDP